MEKTYIITNRVGAVNMLNEYHKNHSGSSVPENVFNEMVEVMFDGTHYIVDHKILTMISNGMDRMMAAGCTDE